MNERDKMNLDDDYIIWIEEIKKKVRTAQIKAAVTINKELILFYWDFGKMLTIKMENTEWGDKVLDKVSKDLRKEFPDMSGFSKTNLKYIKRFYEYFSSQNLVEFVIGHQAGDQLRYLKIPGIHEIINHPVKISSADKHIKNQQLISALISEYVSLIPWRHIIEIFTKTETFEEALFYIQKTKENNWSRNTLGLQIKSDLYHRKGKSITNFQSTLPVPMSDLAQETLKDPYVFDFLQLSEDYKERELEAQLIVHIQEFLLELGKGFAFVSRQYNIVVAEKDYFIDLLFYHIRLKCYVVIELKNSEFKPEYAGKLNFYLSAVDSLLKQTDDRPTIGILLCREKNMIDVEFALRGISNPIGVSEFELTDTLPDHLQSSLPTIEEFEKNLKGK